MIIRIFLVVFISCASGICYLAGLARLTSALLITFGAFISLLFGVLFLLPAEQGQLWFPVHGDGSPLPFFILAGILLVIVSLFFIKKNEPAPSILVTAAHFRYLLIAFFCYILSLFLPLLLWFPSEEMRISLDVSTLATYAFAGTCVYLLGTMISLYLFYRVSQASADNYPDLMRRVVLTLFSLFQFDKMPVFVAFLLVYSPESKIIFPMTAALALSAYIPIGIFFLKLSWQSEEHP